MKASEGMVTFVCLLASMCHPVFLQLMCLCVSAITLVKLVRLLAILFHHACEFGYMFPNLITHLPLEVALPV